MTPKTKQQIEERKEQQRLENRGTAARNADYKRVYRQTGDHRAAVRAYCAGNKWLTENAKAVGNW